MKDYTNDAPKFRDVGKLVETTDRVHADVLNEILQTLYENTFVNNQLAKEAAIAKDEQDPTVPQRAKEPTKPVYSASDVGAIGKDELQDISISELEELWDSI